MYISRSTAKITAHVDLGRYMKAMQELVDTVEIFQHQLHSDSVKNQILELSHDPVIQSLPKGFSSYPFPPQLQPNGTRLSQTHNRNTKAHNHNTNRTGFIPMVGAAIKEALAREKKHQQRNRRDIENHQKEVETPFPTCTFTYGKDLCLPLKILYTYQERVAQLKTSIHKMYGEFRLAIDNYKSKRKRRSIEEDFKPLIDKIVPYIWGSLSRQQRKNITIIDALIDAHGVPKPLNRTQILLLNTVLRKLRRIDRELYFIVTRPHTRERRSAVLSIIFGIGMYKNRKAIKQLRREVTLIKDGIRLHDRQIQELHRFANVMRDHMAENDERLSTLDVRSLIQGDHIRQNTNLIGKLFAMSDFSHTVEHNIQTIETTKFDQRLNHEDLYELLRLMSSRKLNTVAIPPKKFKEMLRQLSQDLRTNPKLRLPFNPEEDIWFYYDTAKVTPLLLDQTLLIMIDIPLMDSTLAMDVFEVHNLPKLDPALQMQYQYQIEGKFLAITRDGRFATLPNENFIHLCLVTQGHICILDTALYPVDELKWCVYALFKKDVDLTAKTCKKNFESITTLAVNLRGHIWAISSNKEERLQVSCMNTTNYYTIKPAITIVHVGNGCTAYSPHVHIPALNEFSSSYDDDLRKDFFLEFNAIYHNLNFTFSDFNIKLNDLTEEQLEELKMHIEQLPPMNEELMNQRVHLLQEKWTSLISSKVLLAVIIISVITLVIIIILVVIGMLFKLKGIQKLTPNDGGKLKPLIDQLSPIFQKQLLLTTANHVEQNQETSKIRTPPIAPNQLSSTKSTTNPEIFKELEPVLKAETEMPRDLQISAEVLNQALSELKEQGYSSPKVEKYKRFLQKKKPMISPVPNVPF